MADTEQFDKIIESVWNRIQDEIGGLIGAEFRLTSPLAKLLSKKDFFGDLRKTQVIARMDVTGDVEAMACSLVTVKDAILLGGRLIMLPPSELDEDIANENYAAETENSYGEIANIVAETLTHCFEEMFPKACRFTSKDQEVLSVQGAGASDAPVPDQPYYQVASTMQLDGKLMGEMIILIPAIPFGLAQEQVDTTPEDLKSEEIIDTPIAAESDIHGEADGSEDVPSSINSAEETDLAKDNEDTLRDSRDFDAEVHKKNVDELLNICREKIEEEIGTLLGLDFSCSSVGNKLICKEDFFFEEASGKQVVTNLEVVGDLEDTCYLYFGFKNAIRLGGILVMLPPTEIERAVSEDDFNADSQDAYGEIINIISTAYTTIFDSRYVKSIQFIKKDIAQVLPMKVDTASDEPMPDQLYYLSSMKLTVNDTEYGKLQMLFPADMLQLESFGQIENDARDKDSEIEGSTSVQNNTTEQTADDGGVQPTDENISPDVLIVSDSEQDARLIIEAINVTGMSCKQLSIRDNIKEHLPGTFKAVFLVMGTVDEQCFGVAIKISSACSLPLIATGADWTRSKVIKAVKYGVKDILLTPASQEEIREKIQNNISKIAA